VSLAVPGTRGRLPATGPEYQLIMDLCTAVLLERVLAGLQRL
jgi:hypothetical protein